MHITELKQKGEPSLLAKALTLTAEVRPCAELKCSRLYIFFCHLARAEGKTIMHQAISIESSFSFPQRAKAISALRFCPLRLSFFQLPRYRHSNVKPLESHFVGRQTYYPHRFSGTVLTSLPRGA